MMYDELPEDLKRFVDDAERASATIAADIGDALESSRTPDEFVSAATAQLESLKAEADAFLGRLSGPAGPPNPTDILRGLPDPLGLFTPGDTGAFPRPIRPLGRRPWGRRR